MSVVLSILKIIGIILLVILCIILALLLIVLFVPIRYNAHVVKEERGPDGKITEGLTAQAGISWLLHIISFGVSFKEGRLSKGLKIFGIDLSKRKKKKEKKKKRKTAKEGPERPLSEIAEDGKKKKAKAESAPKDLLTAEVPEEEAEISEEETAGAEGVTAEETESAAGGTEPPEDAKEAEPPEAAPEETGQEEAAGEPQQAEETPDEEEKTAEKAQKKAAAKKKKVHRKKAGSFREFLWRIAEALYNVIRKIVGKIKGVIEKLKGIFALIEKWTDFLEDDRTQDAIALALKEVGGILKGLLPKKVRGYVRFGHDDPSKTGQQLAYLAAAYPLYGKNLDIYPDFEKKALEGDIELKGRVVLAAIVWAGLKLILNKNIKYVIRFVRNKEDKANGGE